MSRRLATTELPLPAVSLASGLPPSFRTGSLVEHLVDSFDQVLAPAVASLDDLDAYLDPRYAPPDFVSWLGTWLNTTVTDRWPAERLRDHLPDLLTALLNRGTAVGLAAALRACTGADAQVDDNGGVAWNPRPNGTPGGQPGGRLHVTVAVDEADDAGRAMVQAVIEDMKPAHVLATVVWAGGR